MPRYIIALALLPFVAACTIREPNPPSVSARDVDLAFANAARASTLPVADTFDLPTGTVTYDGQIGADVNGDTLGSVLADMRMVVDFRDNDIGGDVTNINLIDQNGIPNQRFDGSLTISGFENNGDLDAGASGRIGAVDVNGNALDADMFLDLEGTVRNDRSFGDTVYGSATGDVRGDFNLDVEGVFYGEGR